MRHYHSAHENSTYSGVTNNLELTSYQVNSLDIAKLSLSESYGEQLAIPVHHP
jgi:hypothetical protein